MKKSVKGFLMLILICILALSTSLLVACGDKKGNDSSSTTSSSVSEQTTLSSQITSSNGSSVVSSFSGEVSSSTTSSSEDTSCATNSNGVHSFDYMTRVIAPTCTEQGYTLGICNCGATTISNYTNATGHDYTYNVVVTEPTCTVSGYTKNTCHCGDYTTTNRIGATGHNYNYNVKIVAPTCTEQGYTLNTCHCGSNTKTNYTTAMGHDYTFNTQVVQPTCTEQGYTTNTCYCGASTKTDYTNVTAHINVNGYCSNCGDLMSYKRVDASNNESTSGTYVLFGNYPQSEVEDTTLISTLNTKAGTLPTSSNSYSWTSYEYYITSSNTTDYMWYIDVVEKGHKYRGVYFTSYRPYSTYYSSSTDDTYQDDNGYNTSTIYWFKYEPIKWRILSEESGKALILCEMLIDSQEYNYTRSTRTIDGETVYANNYAHSSIRKWLNDTFYNTAFTDLQKELIELTTVDNSASTTYSSENQYACENTEDNIFLLSYKDMKNSSYGFSTSADSCDAAKQKQTTAYAQCQGAYTSTSSSYAGNGHLWLRSPNYNCSTYAYYVSDDGDSFYDDFVNGTSIGVCPALYIRLT